MRDYKLKGAFVGNGHLIPTKEGKKSLENHDVRLSHQERTFVNCDDTNKANPKVQEENHKVSSTSPESRLQKKKLPKTTSDVMEKALKKIAKGRSKKESSTSRKYQRVRDEDKLLKCPREGCHLKYSTESSIRNHIRLKHKPLDKTVPIA
eukprot:Awhi_evm1s6242